MPRSFINSLVVLADFTIFLSQFNNVHDRAEFAAGKGRLRQKCISLRADNCRYSAEATELMRDPLGDEIDEI